MDSIEASGPVKALFQKIFTPKAGSNFDYALNAKMGLNLNRIKLDIGYRHIGPGHVSLGIPSTVSDRQEWLSNSSFKLGIHRIRLG